MIGIGCDIIEIERIKRAVSQEHFVERVFTVKEIEYCRSRGKQAESSFAARFAAKEALLKALGTGHRGGSLTDIEVLTDALGKPELKLTGYYLRVAEELGVKKAYVTLSHSKENALAFVTLE